MIKVLVGIPTYNGANRVDYLLQSISMRTNKDIDYKIIVCDDGGKKEHQEKTKLVVEKWNSILPIELLINDNNLGVSKTWNKLIKLYDSEYIILINDDVIVANRWLDNLLYFLENNPNAGSAIYGCIFINEEDIPQLLISLNPKIKPRDPFTKKWADIDYSSKVPIRCMVAWGCFFGFKRHIYNLIGGFDENYFAYFEEYDFLTDIASRGYPNYLLTCPRNWHIWSATFDTSPELNPREIYGKSQKYYIKKWNAETVTMRYMSKIPFQKVKWICNGDIYEKVLTDDYGYFKIELSDQININVKEMKK
jgi:GT2 family glycosyltransferase